MMAIQDSLVSFITMCDRSIPLSFQYATTISHRPAFNFPLSAHPWGLISPWLFSHNLGF